MKAALRLLTCLAFTLGVVVSAQTTTTYNLAVPTACGAMSANYHCTVQAITPLGPNAIGYDPYYNGQPNIVQFFTADSELGAFGIARIDSVTATGPFNTVSSGVPNQINYYSMSSYTQKSTFHGTDIETALPYTGSMSIQYTVSTRCCTSGRGPHQASTWTITGGTVSIRK